jgi:LuxR family maltose regulon positive regulatory protein
VIPAEAAARAASPGSRELVTPLTERELDVLRLIASGCSNQEIADELFLTVSTVKWYAGQIFGKLEVHNRTGAATRARALGIVT